MVFLHREHGLNPSIAQCFFCGKEKNEVVLLGARYKGEAPRHILVDYEPCDTCKSNMEKGITLIECSSHPYIDNQPPIAQGLYPTSSWCVITPEAAARLFKPDHAVESILKHRKAFVEVGMLAKMGVPDGKEKQAEV